MPTCMEESSGKSANNEVSYASILVTSKFELSKLVETRLVEVLYHMISMIRVSQSPFVA